MRPGDGEMSLYLGSAQLLSGDPAAAIPSLEVAAHSADPTIRSEALWQLLNAQLLAERRGDALATARDLSARGDARRVEADSLIARIERSRPSP